MSQNNTTTRIPRKNSAPITKAITRSASDEKPKASPKEIEASQKEVLDALNTRTGQVKFGNEIVWVDMARFPEMAFRSKAAMSADFAERTVLNNDGYWTEAWKWWLSHKDRRKFGEVVFDPARFFRDGRRFAHAGPEKRPDLTALNLFTGWAKKESSHGNCDLFYEHLRENYTNGDAATYEVVLNWMAHLFQKPGQPIGWALAVVGDYGSGKSIVSDVLMEIIGKRYSPIFTTPESLLGKFNAPLAKCILGRVEEAINPRDPRHISTLKSLLSGGDVMLELKGVDPIVMPSRANFIFTSNSEHFLAAGSQGERRYFAFRCGNGRQQDGAFFAAMRKQLEAGGYSKLLDDLLKRDISAVNFTSPPRTAVLSQQIRAGLSGLDRWWADCLEAGELIFSREPETAESLGWTDWADDRVQAQKAVNDGKAKAVPAKFAQGDFAPLKEMVMASATAYARDYSGRPPSPAQVGRFLSEQAGADVYRGREGVGHLTVRVQRFVLPSLDECRVQFVQRRPGLRIEDVGSPVRVEDATAAEPKPATRTAKVFTMARPAVRVA